MHGSHFLTNSSAFSTHFSAFAAVLHAHLRVFFAFFCTGMAYFCTDAAKLFAETPAQAHHFGRRLAKGRAFEIELYTGFQLGQVLFIQTGRGTLTADGGAILAGVNTFLILLV